MTQKRLKELVHYEPETGIFTNLITRSSKAIVGKEIGTKDGYGYLKASIDSNDKDRTEYKLHRLAFLYMKGYIPEQIDHINQNREDNRWENLRGVSNKENSMNRSLRSDSKSGITGVTWDKSRNKWVASIQTGNKIKRTRHNTLDEAVIARNQMKKQFGFHENHS